MANRFRQNDAPRINRDNPYDSGSPIRHREDGYREDFRGSRHFEEPERFRNSPPERIVSDYSYYDKEQTIRQWRSRSPSVDFESEESYLKNRDTTNRFNWCSDNDSSHSRVYSQHEPPQLDRYSSYSREEFNRDVRRVDSVPREVSTNDVRPIDYLPREGFGNDFRRVDRPPSEASISDVRPINYLPREGFGNDFRRVDRSPSEASINDVRPINYLPRAEFDNDFRRVDLSPREESVNDVRPIDYLLRGISNDLRRVERPTRESSINDIRRVDHLPDLIFDRERSYDDSNRYLELKQNYRSPNRDHRRRHRNDSYNEQVRTNYSPGLRDRLEKPRQSPRAWGRNNGNEKNYVNKSSRERPLQNETRHDRDSIQVRSSRNKARVERADLHHERRTKIPFNKENDNLKRRDNCQERNEKSKLPYRNCNQRISRKRQVVNYDDIRYNSTTSIDLYGVKESSNYLCDSNDKNTPLVEVRASSAKRSSPCVNKPTSSDCRGSLMKETTLAVLSGAQVSATTTVKFEKEVILQKGTLNSHLHIPKTKLEPKSDVLVAEDVLADLVTRVEAFVEPKSQNKTLIDESMSNIDTIDVAAIQSEDEVFCIQEGISRSTQTINTIEDSQELSELKLQLNNAMARVRYFKKKAVNSERRWWRKYSMQTKRLKNASKNKLSQLSDEAAQKQDDLLEKLLEMETFSENELVHKNNRLRQLEGEVERARRLQEDAAERLKLQRDDWEKLIDSEFQCTICSEPFFMATTLHCSHTFCQYCLNQWKKTQKTCPICRSKISSESPTLVLDVAIEKMSERLSYDFRQRRQLLRSMRMQGISEWGGPSGSNVRK